MTYTAPVDVVVGELLTAARINAQWAANIRGLAAVPTLAFVQTAASISTGGTSYAAVAPNDSTNDVQSPLFPWRDLDTAGVDPEVRIVARLQAGASSSIEAAVATVTGAANAALGAIDVTNVTAAVSHNTATVTTKDSGWVALNASVTLADFLGFQLAIKHTGASPGVIAVRSTVWVRWR